MHFARRYNNTPLLICLASLFAVASATKVEQYNKGEGWAVETASSVQALRDLIERVAPELQVISKLN